MNGFNVLITVAKAKACMGSDQMDLVEINGGCQRGLGLY